MIDWFSEKENIDELIANGKNYRDIADLYNCSYGEARVQCRKIGCFLPGAKKPKSYHKCEVCDRIIYGNEKQKYCSTKCQRLKETKDKYEKYLLEQDSFSGTEISYLWLKKFILEEQNHTCAIEGCNCKDFWNGKKLTFVLDHVDGDATNNTRENLRLVCPNCDSQLPTFKSRNRGKSTRRYKPYVKGKIKD